MKSLLEKSWKKVIAMTICILLNARLGDFFEDKSLPKYFCPVSLGNLTVSVEVFTNALHFFTVRAHAKNSKEESMGRVDMQTLLDLSVTHQVLF